MPHRKFFLSFVLSLAACAALTCSAQQPGGEGSHPKAGSNWDRVKALPPKTNVHITMDHGGKTCHVFAVSDDSLTCAKGNAAGDVIQRAQIQHIKLTHYGRSTLAGLGIGGGIGVISGAIGTRTKPCPTGQTLCLNGLGGGAALGALVFGVGGGVAGAVTGGATDFTRGSAIYVRP